MHIENMTINLGGPSPIAGALIGAALKSLAEAETDSPEDQDNPPAIGEVWASKGGVYAGLAVGENGEADAHLVLLEIKPEKDLDWNAAVKWAESLGDGARLPTRSESALLYANLRGRFDAGAWHWTGTQSSESRAWYQYFNGGSQRNYGKEFEARARAVRRFTA